MAYIYDLTDTWNAGGTTFNAIKMNVTDSASAAGSKLVTLQTNGTEHFSVTKAGVGYFSSDGLFGLSTASSSRRLRIYGCTATAAASSLQLMTSTSGTGVSDGFTLELDGNEAYVWNYETANIRFGTANAERMRITSAGDVGIGTSSPSNKFVVSNAGANGFEFNTTDNVFQTYNRSGAAYVDFNCYSLNHRIFTGTSPTERMRITSSGDVGIGTSSPAVKLEVASANAITSMRVDTENAGVSANNYSEIALADNNAVRTWWRNVRDGTGKTAFGYNDHLAFLSDAGGTPTERARIDASGNLGLGTSSPTSISNYKAITLDATTGTFIDFRENGTNRLRIGGDGGTAFVNGASGTLRLLTSDVERARIDSSGNVGIGTNSPTSRLNIVGGSLATSGVGGGIVMAGNITTSRLLSGGGAAVQAIHTYSDDNAYEISAGSTSGYVTGIGIAARSYTGTGGDAITLWTRSAERARIDSSGNLLVGTTSAIASGRISVQSTGSAPALVGRSASDSIQLYTTQTSGTSYFGYWVYNGTNVGSITSTGTTTAYNTSSDARLKHDIVDAPEASSLIDAIKVRSFKWNADNSEQRYGMIAQELLEVAPEAVSHDPDDEEKMMGVDYSKLVPMLVKEIQSLRARVAQLEGN